MEGLDGRKVFIALQRRKIRSQADFNIFLRHVVTVDKHLTDLIYWIWVFTLLRISAAKQELSIAAFNDGSRMGLDLLHHAQNLGNLSIKSALCTKEDIPIRMSRVIPVLNQFDVGANLTVIAGNQFEKAQDGALVDGAEDEG